MEKSKSPKAVAVANANHTVLAVDSKPAHENRACAEPGESSIEVEQAVHEEGHDVSCPHRIFCGFLVEDQISWGGSGLRLPGLTRIRGLRRR